MNASNITNEQALQMLYNAARKAPLIADDHDLVRECVIVLDKLIKESISNDTIDIGN